MENSEETTTKTIIKTSNETEDEENPGRQFDVFLQNEVVTERLKLLNYEKEFTELGDSLKIIPRHYFVLSKNVGEQFHLFTSLCTWLIRKSNISSDMEMPHEFEDPNATISRILNSLKEEKEFNNINIPANKLKSGAGKQCVLLLFHLTAIALERSGFQYGIMQQEENEEENIQLDENQVDNAELTTDQFDDDIELAEDEDNPIMEDFDVINNDDLETNDILQINDPLKMIMQNGTTASLDSMKEELERVIPQLRITIRGNQKDWQIRAEQIAKMETGLCEQYEELYPILTTMDKEITDAMERIFLREQNLNEQFANLLNIYRIKKNELAATSEHYKENSVTLNSKTETLRNINEEIDELKQQIEERGIQNTSGAPILKIKQAITNLEKECFVMGVQIATLEQTLIQSRLNKQYNEHIGNNLDYL
ncbi:hypothetical protein Mgra_00000747 [Meloidogyne graminicola]|uniref:Intraflagellar transport protein 57 homolog n=1 Tax=Meloidogyne graminicola TaxID=189291 RepID=A0A8T0A1Z2_9BILA|nr:hypothetical protein Mgra_00000747 [Meloidogyne graminicola]